MTVLAADCVVNRISRSERFSSLANMKNNIIGAKDILSLGLLSIGMQLLLY